MNLKVEKLVHLEGRYTSDYFIVSEFKMPGMIDGLRKAGQSTIILNSQNLRNNFSSLLVIAHDPSAFFTPLGPPGPTGIPSRNHINVKAIHTIVRAIE